MCLKMGYVVDEAVGADRANRTDVAEMTLEKMLLIIVPLNNDNHPQ